MSKFDIDKWAESQRRQTLLNQDRSRRAYGVRLQRPAVWSKSNGRCWYCGAELRRPELISVPSDFTVDHVVPLVDGGTDDLSNLVPACFSCNTRKQRRSLKWLRRNMSGIPTFNQAQEDYLATLGVTVPDGDYIFWFEREGLGDRP